MSKMILLEIFHYARVTIFGVYDPVYAGRIPATG